MSPDTANHEGDSSRRPRRWLRVFGAFFGVLFGLVLIAALGASLGRDFPRRWLEARLAAMLDADVRLARLEIESFHHVVLHGVEVSHPGWDSRVERIAIERLDVEARVRAALAGRYERLVVDGVDLRLVPASRPPRPLPESQTTVRTIEIREGRVVVASDGAETRLDLAAELADWGDDPSGRLSLAAARVDVASLLVVAGGAVGSSGPGATLFAARPVVEGLQVDFNLDGRGQPIRVAASADGLRGRYRSRVVEFRQPRLEATAERDDGLNVMRLHLRPTLPGLDAATVDAELDLDTNTLRSGSAVLQGLAIGTLLETSGGLADGWQVEGRADVRVGTEDGRSFAFEIGTALSRIAGPIEQTTVRGLDLQATVKGEWRGERAPDDPGPLAFDVDATLGSLRVAAGSDEFHATRSRVVTTGTLDATGSGRVRAQLTFAAGQGTSKGLSLPAELFPLDLAFDGTLAAWAAFDGDLEGSSPPLGRVRAQGATFLKSNRPHVRWRWDWSDMPDLPAFERLARQFGLGSSPSGLGLRGRPRATGSLKGGLDDAAVDGRLAIEGLELNYGDWKLDEARADTTFSRLAGAGGKLVVSRLEIAGTGHVPGAAEPWSSPVVITAVGRGDALSGEVRVEQALVDVKRLGKLRLDGRAGRDGSVVVSTHLEPVELPRLRELARLWFDDPIPDFALRGVAESRLVAERMDDGRWQGHGELDLSGVGLGSADGARVVEGAAAQWKLELSGREGEGFEGAATGTVTGPILLWGTLFGDFSTIASDVVLGSRLADGRWETSADWHLPHGVEVSGRLVSAAGLDYELSADVSDLTVFLDRYIRAPFEGSVEHIDSLKAAGRLSVDLHGRLEPGRRDVEGAIRATDTSFSGIDGATGVDALTLDLPIALHWKTDAAGEYGLIAGADRAGNVSYERLRLGGLEFPPLATPLVVAGDTIRFGRPLELAIFDGRMELRQVALAEWSRPQRHLRFGLRLDELSLATLTRALGSVPLDGTLAGTFPAVRLTQDQLLVDGGGTIEIFGGAVEVFDISGADILGRFPRVQFSANLERVHLLDVTRTFDFGEVSGVVNGEIRDCELFAGVPVRCSAWLGSVETKGVPQKISVKAIRNISILGSGPRVGILDRGLQKFFDTYRYSRIGLTMKLDQDRFLLRGTERRGERELFVKGRMPFRIDIVNAAPGRTVSFQTMKSRLQNLQVGKPKKGAAKAPSR